MDLGELLQLAGALVVSLATLTLAALQYFASTLKNLLFGSTQHALPGADMDQLLEWVRGQLPDQPPEDFSASWKDGVALRRLVDRLTHAPSTGAGAEAGAGAGAGADDRPIQNINEAFGRARRVLGLKPTLTVMDVISGREELRLAEYITALRAAAESRSDLDWPPEPPVVATEAREAEATPSGPAAAGDGLTAALTGQTAQFAVRLPQAAQLDLLVEMRSEAGDYFSQRLTPRSPCRRSLEDQVPAPAAGSARPKSNIPVGYQVTGRTVNLFYQPPAAGWLNLSVVFGGQHIEGSPFRVYVGGDGENEKPKAGEDEKPRTEVEEEPSKEQEKETVAEAIRNSVADAVKATSEIQEPAKESEKATESNSVKENTPEVNESVTEAPKHQPTEAIRGTEAKTFDKPVAESVKEMVAHIEEQVAAQSVKETMAEAENEPVAETEKDPVTETAKEPVHEEVKETAALEVEKSVVEAVKEPAAEAAKEPLEEITKELVDAAVKAIEALEVEQPVLQTVNEPEPKAEKEPEQASETAKGPSVKITKELVDAAVEAIEALEVEEPVFQTVNEPELKTEKEPVERAVKVAVTLEVEQSAEEVVKDPVSDTVKETADETVKEKVTLEVEQSIVETVKEPVSETMKELVGEAVKAIEALEVEQSLAEAVKEPAPEAAKESADEAVKEPTEEAVKVSVTLEVVQSVLTAATEPASETVNDPMLEAEKELVDEAVKETVALEVHQSVVEALKESVPETMKKPVEEEVKGTVEEAVNETVASAPKETGAEAFDDPATDSVEQTEAKILQEPMPEVTEKTPTEIKESVADTMKEAVIEGTKEIVVEATKPPVKDAAKELAEDSPKDTATNDMKESSPQEVEIPVTATVDEMKEILAEALQEMVAEEAKEPSINAAEKADESLPETDNESVDETVQNIIESVIGEVKVAREVDELLTEAVEVSVVEEFQEVEDESEKESMTEAEKYGYGLWYWKVRALVLDQSRAVTDDVGPTISSEQLPDTAENTETSQTYTSDNFSAVSDRPTVEETAAAVVAAVMTAAVAAVDGGSCVGRPGPTSNERNEPNHPDDGDNEQIEAGPSAHQKLAEVTPEVSETSSVSPNNSPADQVVDDVSESGSETKHTMKEDGVPVESDVIEKNTEREFPTNLESVNTATLQEVLDQSVTSQSPDNTQDESSNGTDDTKVDGGRKPLPRKPSRKISWQERVVVADSFDATEVDAAEEEAEEIVSPLTPVPEYTPSPPLYRRNTLDQLVLVTDVPNSESKREVKIQQKRKLSRKDSKFRHSRSRSNSGDTESSHATTERDGHSEDPLHFALEKQVSADEKHIEPVEVTPVVKVKAAAEVLAGRTDDYLDGPKQKESEEEAKHEKSRKISFIEKVDVIEVPDSKPDNASPVEKFDPHPKLVIQDSIDEPADWLHAPLSESKKELEVLEKLCEDNEEQADTLEKECVEEVKQSRNTEVDATFIIGSTQTPAGPVKNEKSENGRDLDRVVERSRLLQKNRILSMSTSSSSSDGEEAALAKTETKTMKSKSRSSSESTSPEEDGRESAFKDDDKPQVNLEQDVASDGKETHCKPEHIGVSDASSSPSVADDEIVLSQKRSKSKSGSSRSSSSSSDRSGDKHHGQKKLVSTHSSTSESSSEDDSKKKAALQQKQSKSKTSDVTSSSSDDSDAGKEKLKADKTKTKPASSSSSSSSSDDNGAKKETSQKKRTESKSSRSRSSSSSEADKGSKKEAPKKRKTDSKSGSSSSSSSESPSRDGSTKNPTIKRKKSRTKSSNSSSSGSSSNDDNTKNTTLKRKKSKTKSSSSSSSSSDNSKSGKEPSKKDKGKSTHSDSHSSSEDNAKKTETSQKKKSKPKTARSRSSSSSTSDDGNKEEALQKMKNKSHSSKSSSSSSSSDNSDDKNKTLKDKGSRSKRPVSRSSSSSSDDNKVSKESSKKGASKSRSSSSSSSRSRSEDGRQIEDAPHEKKIERKSARSRKSSSSSESRDTKSGVLPEKVAKPKSGESSSSTSSSAECKEETLQKKHHSTSTDSTDDNRAKDVSLKKKKRKKPRKSSKSSASSLSKSSSSSSDGDAKMETRVPKKAQLESSKSDGSSSSSDGDKKATKKSHLEEVGDEIQPCVEETFTKTKSDKNESASKLPETEITDVPSRAETLEVLIRMPTEELDITVQRSIPDGGMMKEVDVSVDVSLGHSLARARSDGTLDDLKEQQTPNIVTLPSSFAQVRSEEKQTTTSNSSESSSSSDEETPTDMKKTSTSPAEGTTESSPEVQVPVERQLELEETPTHIDKDVDFDVVGLVTDVVNESCGPAQVIPCETRDYQITVDPNQPNVKHEQDSTGEHQETKSTNVSESSSSSDASDVDQSENTSISLPTAEVPADLKPVTDAESKSIEDEILPTSPSTQVWKKSDMSSSSSSSSSVDSDIDEDVKSSNKASKDDSADAGDLTLTEKSDLDLQTNNHEQAQTETPEERVVGTAEDEEAVEHRKLAKQSSSSHSSSSSSDDDCKDSAERGEKQDTIQHGDDSRSLSLDIEKEIIKQDSKTEGEECENKIKPSTPVVLQPQVAAQLIVAEECLSSDSEDQEAQEIAIFATTESKPAVERQSPASSVIECPDTEAAPKQLDAASVEQNTKLDMTNNEDNNAQSNSLATDLEPLILVESSNEPTPEQIAVEELVESRNQKPNLQEPTEAERKPQDVPTLVEPLPELAITTPKEEVLFYQKPDTSSEWQATVQEMSTEAATEQNNLAPPVSPTTPTPTKPSRKYSDQYSNFETPRDSRYRLHDMQPRSKSYIGLQRTRARPDNEVKSAVLPCLVEIRPQVMPSEATCVRSNVHDITPEDTKQEQFVRAEKTENVETCPGTVDMITEVEKGILLPEKNAEVEQQILTAVERTSHSSKSTSSSSSSSSDSGGKQSAHKKRDGKKKKKSKPKRGKKRTSSSSESSSSSDSKESLKNKEKLSSSLRSSSDQEAENSHHKDEQGRKSSKGAPGTEDESKLRKSSSLGRTSSSSSSSDSESEKPSKQEEDKENKPLAPGTTRKKSKSSASSDSSSSSKSSKSSSSSSSSSETSEDEGKESHGKKFAAEDAEKQPKAEEDFPPVKDEHKTVKTATSTENTSEPEVNEVQEAKIVDLTVEVAPKEHKQRRSSSSSSSSSDSESEKRKQSNAPTVPNEVDATVDDDAVKRSKPSSRKSSSSSSSSSSSDKSQKVELTEDQNGNENVVDDTVQPKLPSSPPPSSKPFGQVTADEEILEIIEHFLETSVPDKKDDDIQTHAETDVVSKSTSDSMRKEGSLSPDQKELEDWVIVAKPVEEVFTASQAVNDNQSKPETTNEVPPDTPKATPSSLHENESSPKGQHVSELVHMWDTAIDAGLYPTPTADLSQKFQELHPDSRPPESAEHSRPQDTEVVEKVVSELEGLCFAQPVQVTNEEDAGVVRAEPAQLIEDEAFDDTHPREQSPPRVVEGAFEAILVNIEPELPESGDQGQVNKTTEGINEPGEETSIHENKDETYQASLCYIEPDPSDPTEIVPDTDFHGCPDLLRPEDTFCEDSLPSFVREPVPVVWRRASVDRQVGKFNITCIIRPSEAQLPGSEAKASPPRSADRKWLNLENYTIMQPPKSPEKTRKVTTEDDLVGSKTIVYLTPRSPPNARQELVALRCVRNNDDDDSLTYVPEMRDLTPDTASDGERRNVWAPKTQANESFSKAAAPSLQHEPTSADVKKKRLAYETESPSTFKELRKVTPPHNENLEERKQKLMKRTSENVARGTQPVAEPGKVGRLRAMFEQIDAEAAARPSNRDDTLSNSRRFRSMVNVAPPGAGLSSSRLGEPSLKERSRSTAGLNRTPDGQSGAELSLAPAAVKERSRSTAALHHPVSAVEVQDAVDSGRERSRSTDVLDRRSDGRRRSASPVGDVTDGKTAGSRRWKSPSPHDEDPRPSPPAATDEYVTLGERALSSRALDQLEANERQSKLDTIRRFFEGLQDGDITAGDDADMLDEALAPSRGYNRSLPRLDSASDPRPPLSSLFSQLETDGGRPGLNRSASSPMFNAEEVGTTGSLLERLRQMRRRASGGALSQASLASSLGSTTELARHRDDGIVVFGPGMCQGKVNAVNRFQIMVPEPAQAPRAVRVYSQRSDATVRAELRDLGCDYHQVAYRVSQPGWYRVHVTLGAGARHVDLMTRVSH